MNGLANRLSTARMYAGFRTQTAAAVEMGVNRQRISQWELGRRVPTLEYLRRAAAVYGVSADWLLGLPLTTGPFFSDRPTHIVPPEAPNADIASTSGL